MMVLALTVPAMAYDTQWDGDPVGIVTIDLQIHRQFSVSYILY